MYLNFTTSLLQVLGTIKDASGTEQYTVKGYWDEKLECSKIVSGEGKNVITEPAVLIWKAMQPE